uniref:Uncharacterized protein n=1 Tax=Entomoneis paludosa TaxID=265537 RepID=A0A7S2YNW0_9STRA|mmetsp:Transcript_40649/g.84614  ORF Transcript_40649/g.84614 Transcript_40649/m.84614 type:complete len:314 (+) Transcript_40649:76-1017(+)
MTKNRSIIASFLAALVCAAATYRFYVSKKDHNPKLEGGIRFYENFRTQSEDPSAVAAQDVVGRWKDDLPGFWQGQLSAPANLRIIFRFTEKYGQVHAYSLDQGGGLIPATSARYFADMQELWVVFDSVLGVFQGKLLPEQNLIKGVWTQAGRNFDLNLKNGGDVPREFRFLNNKVVTGPSQQLQEMAGFWSGEVGLDNDEKELVIVYLNKVSNDLVEPMVFLPNEHEKNKNFPVGIRNFVLGGGDTVKIVLDDPLDSNNAIFEGKWDREEKTISGLISYDDTDDKDPLVLVWSQNYPASTHVLSIDVAEERRL